MNAIASADGYNVPRFRPGRGHVESWFVRANHPTEPKALWLKATILARNDGQTVADTWCSLFDGDRTVALKSSCPLAEARFEDTGRSVSLPTAEFVFDPGEGTASGSLEGNRGAVSWDLRFEAPEGSLAEPICLLPSSGLLDARFPKNKLVTPMPLLTMRGSVTWGGEPWPVDGWLGMQGHNWGEAHSPEYAWGHIVFTDSAGTPTCVAEGASGRLQIGPARSPLISLLTVRTADREYRFDRLVDLWRQHPRIAFPEWTLRIRGRDGEAALAMRAAPERMVCLGYENPDGRLSHCLNSKTAAVTLRVNPHDGDAFELVSSCGGALEFLQDEPEPRVGPPC